jgi:hypothetical protein
MLDSLITSKTRIKLLLKFFINTDTQAYLRGLAEEFGDSTNAIRVELNRLTKAGLLLSFPNGRTKLFQANQKHPLFHDLKSLIRKFTGIDQLIDIVLSKLGTVELAFVIGDYAKGIDSGIIDVVIVGHIDRHYLISLVDAAEDLIKRKIRSLVLSREEYEKLKLTLNINSSVIIWNEMGKQ